ncbi:hypothetical protein LUZ62_030023 [Rhynchospora pubera]|uniref:Anaphase-promoting complex subunit 4 WD40 domain-containing protein n=1 Tax=Rhynchospora pubera TaxID=906938 RepID=A0AAV8HRH9_9POAL|nr:hypothetical protein LUZ62_030023 [Rhynchospora pubera]
MDANFSQGSVPDVHVRSWRRLPRASSRPTTHYYGDRFIPLRGGRNMEIVEALLNIPTKDESTAELSPSRAAYRKLLADTMLQGSTRVLCFSNRPRTPLKSSLEPPTPTNIQRVAKKRRHIPQGPKQTLDVPNVIADDQLNVLDWGSEDILAIALDDAVYLWNDANESITELVTITGSSAPITSVSWAPDGRHLATGQSYATVVLYDVTAMKPVRVIT